MRKKLNLVNEITEVEKKTFFTEINAAKRITILGHHNPDFDCVCAILAISFMLKKLYKKDVDIIYEGLPDTLPEEYYKETSIQINNHKRIKTKFTHRDLLLMLDLNQTNRSNASDIRIDLSLFKSVCIVDHHPLAQIDQIEKKAIKSIVHRITGSVCEILYSLLEEDINKLPEKETLLISDILMHGIVADTKCFYINNTTPFSMRIAAKILEKGITVDNVYNDLYSKDKDYFKQIAKLMAKIKFHKAGFHYIFIKPSDLPRDKMKSARLFEEFKSELQKLKEGDVFIILQKKQKEGNKWKYKIGTRSKQTGLGKFFKLIHGGGHELAGGGYIYAKNDKVALKMVARLLKSVIQKISGDF